MKLRLFALFSLSLISALAADQTWTGHISDDMCWADHSTMAQQGKKVDPHECTRRRQEEYGKGGNHGLDIGRDSCATRVSAVSRTSTGWA